uniref:C-type lectin domain-containing protein n=1 Tax=Lutzomyia ayacuchensis TaxID=252632 RepID=L0MXG2_LUTAY|nr:hypothetical protein [Lutzomyia ayacuchensis]
MANHLLAFLCLTFLTLCTAENFVVRKLSSGKVIYVSKTFLSWYDALDFCNKYNLSLVSINSAKENTELAKTIRPILPENEVHVWIGGYKFQDENGENSQRWVNGGRNVTYTNWSSGEPNNANGREYCLEVYYRQYRGATDKWNDRFCTDKHPFVCERKC